MQRHVQRVIDSGLMGGFGGMRLSDDPKAALRSISKNELGSMPYFTAEVLTTAVARGVVLYRVCTRRSEDVARAARGMMLLGRSLTEKHPTEP